MNNFPAGLFKLVAYGMVSNISDVMFDNNKTNDEKNNKINEICKDNEWIFNNQLKKESTNDPEIIKKQ